MSGWVLASAGRSGGASGSSQSPNWNCPSHRCRSPDRSTITSVQACMLASWSVSTATSPNRSCSTVGTTVAASPQAAAGRAGPEHVRDDERHDAVGVPLLQREVLSQEARNPRTS